MDELDKNRKAGLLGEDGMTKEQREVKAEEDGRCRRLLGRCSKILASCRALGRERYC